MRQSSKSTRPRKPHPDFPLYPRNNGQWARKIKGKTYCFGVWADPDAALAKYLTQKDDLLAGRVPRQRTATSEVNLDELCNRFLGTKKALLDAGELSPYSWTDYCRVCQALLGAFGRDRLLTDLLPEDFEGLRTLWAAKWGPVRLGNEINRVRVVFRYGYKNGLMDREMIFGDGFKRPSRKTLRLARKAKGERMFEAAELRRIIKAAGQPLRTMILLGINAGMGNSDVGRLPLAALDLAGGWLNYPRPKTGIDRRCPLWPETVKVLRAWLNVRPPEKDPKHVGLVFTTIVGGSWVKDTSDNPVSKETRKLLDGLGINGHRNFYTLRHTFETVGGESIDQVAVNAIMGHVERTMSAEYRERISDKRLRAVVNHVRKWLFAPAKKARKKPVRKPRLRIAPETDAAAASA